MPDLLTLAVLALVGARLASSAHHVATTGAARRRIVEIGRGLRLHHFLFVPPVLALVLVVATALIQLPVLSFGWWTALGGQGNPWWDPPAAPRAPPRNGSSPPSSW